MIMEVSTLTLLHLIYFLDPGHAEVSLTVHPNRKQFFKYDDILVACEGKWASWPVKKMTGDGKVHVCPAPCLITSAFPATDSGLYWCDTDQRHTNSSIDIIVTSSQVILASPAQPVREGDHVILGCLVHNETCVDTAAFFKDDLQIDISATAHLTLYNVTRADEGLYKCHVPGYGTSPESSLSVRTALCQPSSVFLPFVEFIMRRVLLIAFYLLSTIVIAVRFQHRQTELQPSDDVIMEIGS